jgi:hypothetical protein
LKALGVFFELMDGLGLFGPDVATFEGTVEDEATPSGGNTRANAFKF